MLVLAKTISKNRTYAIALTVICSYLPILPFAIVMYVALFQRWTEVAIIVIAASILPLIQLFYQDSTLDNMAKGYFFLGNILNLLIAASLAYWFKLFKRIDFTLAVAVIMTVCVYAILTPQVDLTSFAVFLEDTFNELPYEDFKLTASQLQEAFPIVFGWSNAIQLVFAVLLALYWLFSLSTDLPSFSKFFQESQLSYEVLASLIIFVAIIYYLVDSVILRSLLVSIAVFPVFILGIALVHWLLDFYNQSKLGVFTLFYLSLLFNWSRNIVIILVLLECIINIRKRLIAKQENQNIE